LRSEPRWLSVDVVIDINRQEVAATDECFAVLNPGLLESTVVRPWKLWHYENVEDVVTLAAALLVGIGRNNPFQHGNERTGLTAAVMSLRLIPTPAETDSRGGFPDG
jgi:death-on-curing protein